MFISCAEVCAMESSLFAVFLVVLILLISSMGWISEKIMVPRIGAWLYAVLRKWAPIIWAPILQVLENAFVLGVLLLFAAVFMIFSTWVLAVLGMILLLGVHKSGVIKPHLAPWAKLAWYALAMSIITLIVYEFREVVMNELVPRADLRIDEVTVEILTSEQIGMMSGVPGSKLPMAVEAHISGHNMSTSVPTSASGAMVRAAIAIRPLITGDHLEKEDELFTGGGFANEAYDPMPYAIAPLQPFSFSKRESLSLLDAQGVNNTGNVFFDNWNALTRGDVVLYVVTTTRYRDRWGLRPELRTCNV